MMDSGILKASNHLHDNIQQAKWLRDAKRLRADLHGFCKLHHYLNKDKEFFPEIV
jgi:hypothetical protein